MKKLIIVFFALIITTGLVMAAVSFPLPTEFELKKGETGRFKFQIQANNEDTDVKCSFSFQGDSPLKIDFDDKNPIVTKGTIKEIFGSVTAPTEFGEYAQKFCVACTPASKDPGVSVAITTCDLPIKVKVVNERKKENLYVPAKESALNPLIVLVALIIIVGLVVVNYFYHKPKAIKKQIKKKKRK